MSALPLLEIGYPHTELRRTLVAAILAGEKTATSGLLDEYEADREDVPSPGDRYALAGYDGEAAAVVEITEARVVPAREIDVAFARDEGEGFESVEDWRVAHERFFERPIGPETRIVALRFRVVAE
jgi:uncharacterized protein YhfF